MKLDKLVIYTDGACKGNPGPAGIGGVFYHGEEKIGEFSKDIGQGTNNIAEYSALIYALEEAKKYQPQEVNIFTDSQLIYRQLIGEYKVKHADMKTLYEKAQNLAKTYGKVKIQHIPREKNSEADKLATSAIDEHKHSKVVASTFFEVGEESPSSEG